jgi:hypothetical protein
LKVILPTANIITKITTMAQNRLNIVLNPGGKKSVIICFLKLATSST